MFGRRLFHLGAAGALAAPMLRPAHAAGRPVSVVVPYAPGGITDALARLASEWLTLHLDRPFVVENQGGAAGAIAAARVARARPDGGTLLFTNVSTLCITPYTQHTEYLPADFDPISIVGTSAFFVVVGPHLPVPDVAGLVTAARARPGAITYASAGVSSLTHLATALIAVRAGIELTHVPYRGAGPAFSDLLAGAVDMMTTTPAEVAPHLAGGLVRAIAITSPQRSPRHPGLPAVAETLPGYDLVTWNGFVAPKGSPPPFIAEVSDALRAAARDPTFRERLDRLGTDPVDHSPAEFTTQVRRDAETWGALIARLGLRLE